MEKPIFFNGEMVRAILDGRKTQTRRIVKPQPPEDCQVWAGWVIDSTAKKEIGSATWTDVPGVLVNKEHHAKCPFVSGDLLWVRESLRRYKKLDGFLYYTAQYMATDTPVPYAPGAKEGWCGTALWQWKNTACPSIHMPRWASRITLRITNVRVERLQDITYGDAVAEGTPGIGLVGAHTLMLVTGTNNLDDAEKAARLMSFAELWDSIPLGYSWESNPWVWVIEFERESEK